MRLEWSPDALDDLDGIFDYIAQDNPDRAFSFIGELRSGIYVLKDAPRIGTIIQELGDDAFREYYIKGYNFIYEIKEESILIHEVYNPQRIFIRSYNRASCII